MTILRIEAGVDCRKIRVLYCACDIPGDLSQMQK
jgi:hypothetical protein